MEDATYTILTPTGELVESVQGDSTVADVIASLNIEVAAGTHLKLVQGANTLLDNVVIGDLDPSMPIYAITTQETDVEKLLLACGLWYGYKEKVQAAAAAEPTDGKVTVGPMPNILDVLDDMAPEPVELPNLSRHEETGEVKFSGADGDMLLPNIDLSPILEAKRLAKVDAVTICVAVNSDSYNRGLGVVLEAHPSLADEPVESTRIPRYVYNGYGLGGEGKRRSAVKFHPGMGGGQLRVEGVGGFGNSSIGFTPANWTDAGGKLHAFELTLHVSGRNSLSIRGTNEGQKWSREWNYKLFDGRHAPAVYAWLDLGSTHQPLYVSPISIQVHVGDAGADADAGNDPVETEGSG